jgi:phosphatidylglycerol:prolipoprotein diacylglycerol transferase
VFRRKAYHAAGFVTGLFTAGYGLGRFLVEFHREPDPQIGYLFGWMTMGQLLCLPMIFAGAWLMTYAKRRPA